MEEPQTEEKPYSKRSVWQWLLLYLVIGGVVYGAIYFVFLHKQNTYSNSQTNSASANQAKMGQNNVYKMMEKGKLGVVMTDPKGMTLYTFAKDTAGVSNCMGGCLQLWPAYMASSQTGNFPDQVSVIKRLDGTLQYAWRGMPLYYYAKDGDSGDAYGNGVGGAWSVIKQ